MINRHILVERKEEFQRIFVVLIMLAITFFLGCTLASYIFQPKTPQLDSAVFRYVGMVMKEGGVPYRDTFDHKEPLIYLFNYLGLFLGKNGIWFFELGCLFATIVLTYRTLRFFCNRTASTVGMCLIVFQLYDYLGEGNYTEEYALPFIVCSLWIFIEFFQKGKTSKLKLMVCGVCFMAVVLLRANMVATWAVFAIAVLVIEIRDKSNKWIEYLFYFCSGAAIVLLPFLIYLIINGAFRDFWMDYVVFNISYTGVGNTGKVQAIRYFLWSAPCAIAGVVGAVRIIVAKEDRTLDIINLIYIAVTVWMIGMGGRTYSHYGIILIPLTIIPTARIFQYLSKEAFRRRLIAGGIIAIILLAWPWWNTFSNKSIMLADQSPEGVIAGFIRENTKEDDLIIQCGHKDIFYVLSDRMAASKYSYPLPIAQINNNVYDEFFDDIRRNKPVVLITDSWTEQDQLDYTEMNKKVGEFIREYGYVEGPKLESYVLYYAPDSNLVEKTKNKNKE